ncbi:putative membrane protein YhjC [Acidisoma sp. 7E03]
MKHVGWLAIFPLIGMFLGPICHNASTPFILGMPFILGWISVWIVITSAVMAVIYWLDPVRGRSDEEKVR